MENPLKYCLQLKAESALYLVRHMNKIDLISLTYEKFS